MDRKALKDTLLKQRELANQRVARPAVQRTLDLQPELNRQEITIVSGVRRCGKSFILSQMLKALEGPCAPLLLEFDDPALTAFEARDFDELLSFASELYPSADKTLLLLDEVQNLTGWERWATQLAKDPRVKIVVTGSNGKLLNSELSTLLTGRHRTHELSPLSFREVLSFEFPGQALNQLGEEQLQSAYKKLYTYGGFPRSYVEQDGSVLPQYFTDIVERDVVARHGARLKRPLKELGRVLCTDNTRLINRRKLASQIGVKDEGTLKRYCQWLEECYLFFEVKGFSPSVRKQLRSHPKHYCVDPSLARYSAFSVLGGESAFLENMVYLELRRRGCEIYYWRSETGKGEVDFVARRAGHETMGIQASLTLIDENTLARECNGLRLLREELGITQLCIVTKTDPAQAMPLGKGEIQILPFADWACG